ncbi:polyprenyl diphosphate synthase [Kibdelosporangium aridum]|uniref:polyprenyl diphosphate synthase n=1 Tax=Kibdelosporangium aridum TaxID=2030 RepID=UPI0005256D66
MSILPTRFSPEADEALVPCHLAVIVDGNRRWAQARHLPIVEGHRRGAANVCRLLSWSRDAGIRFVTVWLLSMKNLLRAPAELRDLIQVISDLVEDLACGVQYRLHHIGDPASLPDSLVSVLSRAESATGAVEGMVVNLAVGYTGRQDILMAIQQVLDELSKSPDTAVSVTEGDISDHLFTGGQPDPELVIRTSGERRISGFMIWQAAEAEFLFSDKLWPDFTRSDFEDALSDYSRRERRLGI